MTEADSASAIWSRRATEVARRRATWTHSASDVVSAGRGGMRAGIGRQWYRSRVEDDIISRADWRGRSARCKVLRTMTAPRRAFLRMLALGTGALAACRQKVAQLPSLLGAPVSGYGERSPFVHAARQTAEATRTPEQASSLTPLAEGRPTD
jgi:hypothetical protein